MPKDLLPVIGTAAGYYFGGPVGGALGGSIGTALAGKPSVKPPSRGNIQEILGQLPGGGQIAVPEIHVPGVSEFFAPLSIRSPAFAFSGGGGDFTFDRIGTDPRDLFDQRIGGYFGNIDELRSRFKPGFSEIRDARAREVLGARQRAASNLSERLANRRVQGSSFARAEQTQLESEFAKVAAEQQAQSFLEEVAVNSQLLQIERQGFETVLNRAQSDLQEYALALQSAGLSAQVGTARSLAEADASAQEAALSVQAQAAQIDAVLSTMAQLNNLSVANAQIQQDYYSGIGNLIGTGIGLLGFGGSTAGVTPISGAGGGSAVPAFPGAGIVSNPLSYTGPITSGNLGIGRF